MLIACAASDVKVNGGDVVEFGNRYISVLATTGHRYVYPFNMIIFPFFTGDALLEKSDYNGYVKKRILTQ